MANINPVALLISVTAIIITTIITAAFVVSEDGKAQVTKKEHEIALSMIKQCGDRRWVSWLEYSPKGRRIQCYEKGK